MCALSFSVVTVIGNYESLLRYVFMPVKPIMHTGELRGECYNNLGTLTARINDLRIIESFQQSRNIIWRSQL